MIVNMVDDQKEFMQLGNQSTTTFNPEQMALYESLIKEEVHELRQALEYKAVGYTGFEEEIIKEACDVIVVTLGLLLSMGIDVHKAWELVHKNNMSKVSNQDTIVKDEYGKIMKSPESKARKAKMMEDIRGLLNDNTSTR